MNLMLEYALLGHTLAEDAERKHKLLLFNGALPSLEPDYFLQLLEHAPLMPVNGAPDAALAVVEHGDEQMLMVRSRGFNDAGGGSSHYVYMPHAVLPLAATELEPWLAQLPQASPDIEMTLPLLPAPVFAPLSLADQAQRLARLLQELPGPGIDTLLQLLAAALDEHGLVIARHPPGLGARLQLVAGLQSLLPWALAPRLSFSTHALRQCQYLPRIVFDAPTDEQSRHFDWTEGMAEEAPTELEYTAVLRQLWQGDELAWLEAIQQLSKPATALAGGGNLAEHLQQLAQRYRLDDAVRSGEPCATGSLLAVLNSDAPPSTALHSRYITSLLRNALQQRDSEAGRRVAEEIEHNPHLESELAGIFDEVLADQPDAVYVFIRNRLMQQGLDERWLPRLHEAGRLSLQVAIQDGDAGTLAGWLELLAHEPHAYGLQELLRDGLVQSIPRAYADGELCLPLLLIASRRVPELLPELLQDARLLASMPDPAGAAISEPSAGSFEALPIAPAEPFLFALYHGLQRGLPALVSSEVLGQLLQLAAADSKVNLPSKYRAPVQLRGLATQGCTQLSGDAVQRLLHQIVLQEERDIIRGCLQHFAEQDRLFPYLNAALEQDDIAPDRLSMIMQVVGWLENADPRAIIDSFLSLLDHLQWDAQQQRLMKILARVMGQYPEVKLSYRHLWALFSACVEQENESGARAAITRILAQLAEEEELEPVVEGLDRICRQIDFSTSLQDAVNKWWRDYTRSASLPQIQNLRRLLEGRRVLEPQKHSLLTVVAMRRWLHNRAAIEFAEAMNATSLMLEHLSDAFDGVDYSALDPNTIRLELDMLSQELSSEELHILANNIRSIAGFIPQMAENRSKPSLIRSDDSIDRQLTQGEASPHGSVDMMKWVAGYLVGAHQQGEHEP